MGFRCTWIATRGRDRADVLGRLKFTVTAELNEEVYDPGLYAVEIGTRLVVMGQGSDYMDLVTPQQAAQLSDRGEVLYFFTDDTSMGAQLISFVGGREAWSVTYVGMDGISTPELTGKPPDDVHAVLAEARQAQEEAGDDDADYIYDGLANLGHALVGFRGDETLSNGEHLPIYVLRA